MVDEKKNSVIINLGALKTRYFSSAAEKNNKISGL